MAITINEVENGMGLLVDGQLYFVVEYNHVKPGKGSAFVRIRLRNVKTDAILERTFRSADSLEDAPLERRRMQFTYEAGEEYHFMAGELGNQLFHSRGHKKIPPFGRNIFFAV